jgi:hypothetical protein
LAGTLTLFLVLQNIGLLESNYVQIALLGMAQMEKRTSIDKTIVFNNSLILQPQCLFLQISEGKTVTVPAGNSLSLIFFIRVWEPSSGE